MDTVDCTSLLREHGMRATEGRIHLLQTLAAQKEPKTIEQIQSHLSEKLDTVSLYRAIGALQEAGIVERVDLNHDHAHYELVVGRDHHHHIVCNSCGTVEDIEIPHSPDPTEDAMRHSKQFRSIDSYSLQFFGLCKTCS